ncbi:MAG: NYN domain-containing protein [Candidatus Omnitrophica bacterium]|nr:NYN domain-containing protein [Candidatus Omnitrophota bacterium]
MVILIDAYNVIHAIRCLEETLDKGLRASREHLIRLCQAYQAQRGDVEKIILVFDGSTEVCPSSEPAKIRGVEVVYTETGEDADERIVEMLQSRRFKIPVVVVSNDHYVSNHSRALGARVISAAEFYAAFMRKRRSRDGSPYAESSKKVSDALAREITAEYKRHLKID